MVNSLARRRVLAGVTMTVLIMAVLAAVPVNANPLVPSCGPASAAAGIGSATAEQYDPAQCESFSGRVFPEAFPEQVYTQPDDAGHSNTAFATDYVSYFEFQQGLEYLAAAYPDYIEVHEVAQSAGNNGNSYPVYMLEITNENSPIPMEERQALLFMLSIHGNEKGGREGGFRVLEDLLKGISFAAETVQDGAGMPNPLEKPTGGNVEIYHDYLDFQRLFLLFPNVDGWTCDELEMAAGTNACAGTFRRTNANSVDLNRQAPTLGWVRQGSNSHESVKEPESVGYYNWMLTQGIDWTYAIDIHGMTGHQNFAAIMLPAGSMTPQEMERSLGLAETLKQRLNNPNPHFDEWLTLMSFGEVVADQNEPVTDQISGPCYENVGAVVGGLAGLVCPGDDGFNPTGALGSSQFAEYYTVIDAIGYTDSGFNGDYFAQDTGLNAPGYDIELAWNHQIAGAQYEAGALWNNMHVEMVREIVKSFMDAAALDVTVTLETNGLRTLVIENPVIVTNMDDVDAEGNPMPFTNPDAWAAQNPGDDLWEYSADNPFFARPHKYWEDMVPFVADDGAAGVLNFQRGSNFNRATLDQYDNLVIAGSALQVIEGDQSKIDMIVEWTLDGGTLILTDEGLRFLDLAGITQGAVAVEPRYMGGIKVANYFGHELLENVRGGVMQMYEPTPLGFGTTRSAPNWFVAEDAWTGIGGEIAGRECGETQLNTPACDDRGIALGQVAVGDGMIRIMGALLPDPTEEFYHPYGLDHYSTTYSGNAIMLNLLGFDKVYTAPPITIDEDGRIIDTDNEPTPRVDDDDGPSPSKGKGIPGPNAALLVMLVGALATVLRRRS